MTKKPEQSTNRNNSAYIVAFCLSKFHNHNGMMCIQSLAEHLVKWTQIWGGDGHLWVTGHLFCELPACVSTYPGQCQLPVHDTVRLVLAPRWQCYQFVSMLSHPSDTSHHRRSLARFSPLHHASLSRLIRLAARRLSIPPHLSLRGQDCRQITSLAFHLCHTGMLPLWQLAAVFSRRKKKSTGLRRAGWEPNNSWQCARHRAVILMAAVGMYGPEVTQKRPACVCSCIAGKQGTCRLNQDVRKELKLKNSKFSVSTKSWCNKAQILNWYIYKYLTEHKIDAA